MSEKMTLEQVRDECRKFAIQALSPSNRDWYNGVADAIDTHLNAAKGEAVAWRYRFYGSQGWVYATAGEGLVCGLPLICSQPLYVHPASPDVVLDAERYRWLCEQCEGDGLFIASGSTGTWGECGHSDWAGMKELLDERIDEAMAAREGGK